MELIFESVEERDEFLNNMEDSESCPAKFCLDNLPKCKPHIDCKECWKQAVMKCPIKVPDNTPRTLYISTAELHPNPLLERLIKDSINRVYGKNCVGCKDLYFKPKFEIDDREPDEESLYPKTMQHFLVMPRHCGRTAVMKMMDDLDRHGYFGTPTTKPLSKEEKDQDTSCELCKNADVHEFDEPCKSCKDDSNFEKKEERSCKTCKNYDTPSAIGPCYGCNGLNGFPNFEGKEEKKEPTHNCITCKFQGRGLSQIPCRTCVLPPRIDQWEPKEAK